MIPAAKRELKNYAWVTSENFASAAWLQLWTTLPSAVKQEFEDNLWGLPDECMATMDFWKEDYCGSLKGKGKAHLATIGTAHPSEAWIKTCHQPLQDKLSQALGYMPQVLQERMDADKAAQDEEEEQEEEDNRKDIEVVDEDESTSNSWITRMLSKPSEDSSEDEEDNKASGEYGWTEKMLEAEEEDSDDEGITEVADLSSLQHLPETDADLQRILSPRKQPADKDKEQQPLYSPQQDKMNVDEDKDEDKDEAVPQPDLSSASQEAANILDTTATPSAEPEPQQAAAAPEADAEATIPKKKAIEIPSIHATPPPSAASRPAADSDASTVFEEPEDDEGFRLSHNSEWELVEIKLRQDGGEWRLTWRERHVFRPIVVANSLSPPGAKVSHFKAERMGEDGEVIEEMDFAVGDMLKHGRNLYSLHSLHLNFVRGSDTLSAASGHLDLLGLSAKHADCHPLVPKAGKSYFVSVPIGKITQLYKLCTIITPSSGIDPRTKFPATKLAAEQGYIQAVNVVMAKCKELEYMREQHGVCKTTGVQDLRKMAGSLQPLQELNLPWVLGAAAQDIVDLEVHKYKGDTEISLTQMAATTRSQAQHTVSAEEILRAIFPL